MQEDMSNEIIQIKKQHQIEMITLRKNARKAQLDFFKEQSEMAMRVFKQEQIFMVEEYFMLKQRDTQKTIQLAKQDMIIL